MLGSASWIQLNGLGILRCGGLSICTGLHHITSLEHPCTLVPTGFLEPISHRYQRTTEVFGGVKIIREFSTVQGCPA